MTDEKAAKPIPSSKGKERASQQENIASGPDQPRSGLLSRIADSTTGLIQDTFNSANVNASEAISSTSLLGGKIQASGSAGRGYSLGGTTVLAGDLQNDRAGSKASGANSDERFRSITSVDGIDEEFEQFQVGDGFQPSQSHSEIQQNDHEWSSKQNVGDSISAVHSIGASYEDGAEVCALLADPNFNVGIETYSAGPTEEQSVDDLFPQNFSVEEELAVNKIKADLPAAPTHKPMPADHPLSLRPLSNEDQESLLSRLEKYNNSMAGSGQLPLQSQAEMDDWLADWEGVLNTYTDEVWGNVLPEVERSREDIEKAKQNHGNLDTKAVARLKMLLGHLRTHESQSR